MKIFSKNLNIPTYIKYFFSYLIIFSLLFLGFFYIMKTHLPSNYFEQRCKQTKSQLDTLSENLKNDIVFLTQVDDSIHHNTDIMQVCYNTSNTSYYLASKELSNYASTSNLISSIVYLPKTSSRVLSSYLSVTYQDEIFYILHDNNCTFAFDPRPYFDAHSGQLVFVPRETGDSGLLIYFPASKSSANYIYFYVLDAQTILSQLKSLVSEELPSIALLDPTGRLAFGFNSQLLSASLDQFPLTDGIYNLNASTTVCVQTNVVSGFSIVAALSNELLKSEIDVSFSTAYMLLLALGAVVFLLIFLMMRLTYFPLRKLAKTVIPDYNARQNYLQQIGKAFSDAEQERFLLNTKLEKYRTSMQKSLLDSLFISESASENIVLPDIDHLFDVNSVDRKIFVIKVGGANKTFSCDAVLHYFNDSLPGVNRCHLLERQQESIVCLIDFSGNIPDKYQSLKQMCYTLHEKEGYFSAVSKASDSPLDIPSLYENVNITSQLWTQNPVVGYEDSPQLSSSYEYPRQQLNLLSDLLRDGNFTTAESLVKNIFAMLDSYVSTSPMPTFFINCILIDLLTSIANHMSSAYIDFKLYKEEYLETLYLCRSCSYNEKASEIALNTNRLLEIFREQISNKSQMTFPIKQLLEENYCDPNFSIEILAQKYNLSISRMSVVFKTEFNVGFAEYLWTLRLNKAKELLLNTDMSIDNISIAVGYTNPSSFRRKFKQEVGVTPSQYQAEARKDTQR